MCRILFRGSQKTMEETRGTFNGIFQDSSASISPSHQKVTMAWQLGMNTPKLGSDSKTTVIQKREPSCGTVDCWNSSLDDAECIPKDEVGYFDSCKGPVCYFKGANVHFEMWKGSKTAKTTSASKKTTCPLKFNIGTKKWGHIWSRRHIFQGPSFLDIFGIHLAFLWV